MYHPERKASRWASRHRTHASVIATLLTLLQIMPSLNEYGFGLVQCGCHDTKKEPAMEHDKQADHMYTCCSSLEEPASRHKGTSPVVLAVTATLQVYQPKQLYLLQPLYTAHDKVG
jgi:hypothetical protein